MAATTGTVMKSYAPTYCLQENSLYSMTVQSFQVNVYKALKFLWSIQQLNFKTLRTCPV